MLNNAVSAAVVALGVARLASAQTYSACNPVEKSGCPADPAFGGTFNIDFTQGASEYFSVSDGTGLSYDPNNGAVFTIAEVGDAPTITSTKYIFFGTISVEVQTAPGTGIITSSVLQSDDLDEIDWEFLGGDPTQVQLNYFGQGNTNDPNGREVTVDIANSQTGFHTYTVDWQPTGITWIIDGTTVRTLTPSQANAIGQNFPQTPMQLKLGTWDAGAPSEPTGTVQWGGGYTNYADAPFIAYYKSVTITDNSNGVSDASEYIYQGTSGTYTSIQVVTGGNSSSNAADPSSSSTTKTTTSTAGSSSKTTTTSTTTSSPTTMSTTMSVSNSTSSSSSSTTSSGSSSSSPSATTAPKNAAGKVELGLAANAALLVAAVFGVFAL